MDQNNKHVQIPWPQGFVWGAATSAHQVEGGNHNDWSEWEIANAQRLASESEARFGHWLPAWEKIKQAAQNPQNYISGKAANHYELYEQDFDLLKDIGLNAYRFSIEWSRIEPEFGKFDSQALDHYQRVIEALRRRNIEPFVTLWHWTIPTWFRNLGGWHHPDASRYFADFVAKTVGCCIDANYWIVLNEPDVYARQSYLAGDWPPQKRSLPLYFRTVNSLITAHNYAAEAIRQIRPGTQIGVAQNNAHYKPDPPNIINRLAVWPIRWWANHYFLDRINSHLDFVGLNYYFQSRVNFTPYMTKPTKSAPQSDMGWQLHPEGLYHTLVDLKRYKKPVYITEHGLADAQDSLREWYVKESFANMHKAIADGVDLKGYFHWSLLDNFEWDKGFWPRFGLIEVDFETQQRTVRKSAELFRAQRAI